MIFGRIRKSLLPRKFPAIRYTIFHMLLIGIIVIVEPQEAKIPLNKEVNITCKVTGDKQYWLADGAVLDNNTMTERGIAITNISRVPGNMSSNLTVIAIPMNDNLRIGCQGIKQSTREQKFNRSILTVLG